MERVRAEEHEFWLAARAHSPLVEQDARSTAMSSVGAKRLTNAWRYQDRIYVASEEELRWGQTPFQPRSWRPAGMPLIGTSPCVRRRRRHSPAALGSRREAGSTGSATAPTSTASATGTK